MQETMCISGTQVQHLVESLDNIYTEIEQKQTQWKAVSPFSCPEGCGSCCVNFEPDILESEALYLAAWFLYHHPAKANAYAQGSFQSPRPDPEKGCLFFDPASPYHCTVYGGRTLICRLFGYSGDRGKDGKNRLKACNYRFCHKKGPLKTSVFRGAQNSF